MGAYYIVTDLDLRAKFDLVDLDAELAQAGLYGSISKNNGVWRASYASSGGRCCRRPSEAIEELLEIAEGLSENGKHLWDQCISRRFDVGYEGFNERFASRWQIKAPLLRRIADVNGDLVITIYRASKKK